MRFAFIINSQSKDAASCMKALQQKFGSTHLYHLTEEEGSARTIAKQATDEGYSIIVAVGGDGTINEVVNGMIESLHYQTLRPFLGIFPRGSGNDFARSVSATSNIEEFYNRLTARSFRNIDVGLVKFLNHHRESVQRYFINIMDGGLGGCVAQRVNKYRKSTWSFGAYQRAILATLPGFRKTNISICSENFNYDGQALSIVIANGAWFGSGLCIAPDAQPSDGRLEIVLLGKVGFFQYLRYTPQVMRGKKIKHREVKYSCGQQITIHGENLPIELDGEFVGFAPCEISIVPGAIRLIV